MHNYVTGEFDDEPCLNTDEQAKQYIPQSLPAQGLYRTRRKQGDTIEQALAQVLRAVLLAQQGYRNG